VRSIRYKKLKGEELTTQLETLIEVVPSLVDAPEEVQQQYLGMYRAMTTPPKGIDPEGWYWKPDNVKIRHKTTSDGAMPTDAEVGDVWSNGRVLWAAGEDGPKRPFKFMPIKRWISHARFRTGESQPACSAMDGKTGRNQDGLLIECASCPHRPFREGKKTECMKSQNYYVFDPVNPSLMLMTFSKSSYSAGTNITTAAGGKPALWSTVFGLTTKERSNENFTWHVMNVATLGDQPEPWAFEFCDHAYDVLSERRDESIKRLAERASQIDKVLESEDAPASLPGLDDDDGEEEAGFDAM
jgi:hypothetical protein